MKKSRFGNVLKKASLLFLFSISAVSCQLFDNDVNDFMEKYTETAAIEEHSFSEKTYNDTAGNPCISSKKDLEVMLYMRNPKSFQMTPSVEFQALDPAIERTGIEIEQTNFDSLRLLLPQEFLLASDEGKNITMTFTLYEPMSGRYFVGYDIPLLCNSIPPLVESPTIINNNGQNFVIAFDMPDPQELALRHKDITALRINDTDYALSVNADGSFEFEDARFTRTPQSSYIYINDKDFTQTENSVYFETNDIFIQGDKSYTLGLKDSAGLIETSFTSTSISRLSRPLAKDADGVTYPNNSNEMVSGSSTEPFVLSLIPPSTDHKGNPVDDVTLHYTIYKGTSTVAAVIKEGTTTSVETLQLEPGTYFIDTYATKTNYEQSSPYRVTFRIVDNAVFVSQSGNDATADGTRELPFATLNKAMEDIDVRNMPNANVTVYVDGTIYGPVTVGATLTRSITITQRNGGSPAVINAQSNGTAVNVTTTVPVNFRNIKITGGNATNGGGMYIGSNSQVKLLKGTEITGNTASANGGGIYVDGNLTISGVVTINNNVNSSGDRSNVYLPSGKKINIGAALSDEGNNSSIGVSCQSTPSVLSAVMITEGYGYNGGYNNGVHPGTFFIGDSYAINKDDASGEVGLYIDSGTFDELLSSLDISFAIDKDNFRVGTATVINITPTVTVMNGSTPVTIDYSDIQDKIVWTVKLKNGGVDVEGVASSTNSITIPSTVTVPDSYKLYVKAVYDGLYTFDREFDISGHN